MKTPSKFLITAIATAAAIAAPAGAATGTLDQQQTSGAGGYVSAVGPDATGFQSAAVAQTFTAGLSGKLDGIALRMIRFSAGDEPLAIELRDTTADGAPGDGVLATATVPATSVRTDHFDWVPVDFAAPVSVSRDTRYSIVGKTTGAGRYPFSMGFDTYGGGFAWWSRETLPAWEVVSSLDVYPDEEEQSFDLAFKTYVIADHTFGGFASPVDTGVVNTAKAGATIPVRWHLANADGTPVSDPASFVSVTSKAGSGDCAGLPTDAVEDYAGGSGLQYVGDGLWQFNWKTPKSYAGQCRTLILTLSDGSTHTASFRFN